MLGELPNVSWFCRSWKEGLLLFFFFFLAKKKIDVISEPFIFFPWSFLSYLHFYGTDAILVRFVIELFEE